MTIKMARVYHDGEKKKEKESVDDRFHYTSVKTSVKYNPFQSHRYYTLKSANISQQGRVTQMSFFFFFFKIKHPKIFNILQDI